jgi:hypothetical protein
MTRCVKASSANQTALSESAYDSAAVGERRGGMLARRVGRPGWQGCSAAKGERRRVADAILVVRQPAVCCLSTPRGNTRPLPGRCATPGGPQARCRVEAGGVAREAPPPSLHTCEQCLSYSVRCAAPRPWSLPRRGSAIPAHHAGGDALLLTTAPRSFAVHCYRSAADSLRRAKDC